MDSDSGLLYFKSNATVPLLRKPTSRPCNLNWKSCHFKSSFVCNWVYIVALRLWFRNLNAKPCRDNSHLWVWFPSPPTFASLLYHSPNLPTLEHIPCSLSDTVLVSWSHLTHLLHYYVWNAIQNAKHSTLWYAASISESLLRVTAVMSLMNKVLNVYAYSQGTFFTYISNGRNNSGT